MLNGSWVSMLLDSDLLDKLNVWDQIFPDQSNLKSESLHSRPENSKVWRVELP